MLRIPRRMKSALRAGRYEVEELEARVAPAATAVAGGAELAGVALVGRTLSVGGTNGPDRIAIAPGGPAGAVRVVVDGVTREYEGVGVLVVRAGAGDDVVRVAGRVTLPARIEGEAGDDRLQAGSGAQNLLGGDGDDVVIGGRGRAALDAGSGRDRVVIARPLGTIRVGPSAAGEALRVLGRGYRLARFGGGNAASTGPIVVGVADLDSETVIRRLRASYEAGETVALAGAGPGDAERLRVLVGHDSLAQWAAEIPRAALVAFRKVAIDGGRTQSETTVVMPRQAAGVSAAAGHRAADRRVLERLTTVFAASPMVADPPGGPSNLLNLTTSSVSRAIQSNANGDEVQVVNTVYGARSFLNQSDFFYVFQEADFHTIREPLSVINGITTTTLTRPATNPGILQPSPQSTMSTTTVTSGVSYTIGGSVGYNQMQGFNVSLTASVTISNSTTTTYPPINVFNEVDLATGVAEFAYAVLDASQAAGSTLTFYNHWIWQVPFTAYAAGQTSIEFATASNLFEEDPVLMVNLTSTVPTPFGDVFSLQPPRVASVSTGRVAEGQTFKIIGSGLYPSLVTAVLIGGQPLAAGNFQVVSDTEITVIAPDSFGIEDSVVVKTTQGVSNDDVTITIF